MRQVSILVLFGLLVFPVTVLAQGAPLTVGGFTLGEDVEQFLDRLQMDTVLPIRHLESLKEVEMKGLPGFKSGMIYYGTCLEPQRIIRLKLKFKDDSIRFFDELLEAYKKRFGDPQEWRGDPFGVVIAWEMVLHRQTEQQNQPDSGPQYP